ncbi:MAG: aminoacetone oxidase family FAD-binding enzyme, partial [Planctomycetota bacterium]|nr:aminoacetone oxidase family FAD-binding enzyme [Planctomycetota bacterium]
MKDVAIIGAGAAGLATAIFTARRDPTLSILLLDGAKKIGAKILVSGGGRCNVTNEVVTPDDYSGGSRNSIRRVLHAFPVEATVDFFREIGVPLHREDEGKLFPNSNKARSVLDALLAEVRKLGIELKTDHRVEEIEKREEGFEIISSQGTFTAKKLVLATGGKALPKSGSDGMGYQMAKKLGHQIVDPIPALVPLVLEGSFHSALSGIAHPVRLTVRAKGEKPVQSERAMLWTHFGISGPAPMDLSRA